MTEDVYIELPLRYEELDPEFAKANLDQKGHHLVAKLKHGLYRIKVADYGTNTLHQHSATLDTL